MIALADIVKFSIEDLVWLRGPGEADARARSLLANRPSLAILTRGGEEASGYTRHLRVDANTPPVVVADTIGAGDTFNAGILTALHERHLLSRTAITDLRRCDLEAALDLGVTAAAISVSRPGADPPWRN